VALDYDFPLDLIVRTPAYLEERLQMDDWLVREILARGKLLYEKAHATWHHDNMLVIGAPQVQSAAGVESR
jgi:hypothetical protein